MFVGISIAFLFETRVMPWGRGGVGGGGKRIWTGYPSIMTLSCYLRSYYTDGVWGACGEETRSFASHYIGSGAMSCPFSIFPLFLEIPISATDWEKTKSEAGVLKGLSSLFIRRA